MRITVPVTAALVLLSACASVNPSERGACAIAAVAPGDGVARWLKLVRWADDTSGRAWVGGRRDAWADGRWRRVGRDSLEVHAAGPFDGFAFRGSVRGDTLRGTGTQTTDLLRDSAGILVPSASRMEWTGHVISGTHGSCAKFPAG